VCLPGEVTPPRMLLRGGSWDSDPRYCRSARRSHLQPDIAIGNIGLRVVCLPAAIAAELEGGND
jgi:formylglycine-generating enzyme required for sulfatase activity